MAGRLKLLAAAIPAVLAFPASCFGQSDISLSDPTRPPPVAVEAAPATSAEGTPPPSGGLQTIILGRGRKPMAVINGITVGLGDKVGESRLVKLSETQAVLQGPGGREILYLTPGVERMESLKLKPGGEQKRATGRTQHEPTP